jgi:hypothetical protein
MDSWWSAEIDGGVSMEGRGRPESRNLSAKKSIIDGLRRATS